jgi:hypothetical protein
MEVNFNNETHSNFMPLRRKIDEIEKRLKKD